MDNEVVFLWSWQVKQALKGARDSDSVVESELESTLYRQVWSESQERELSLAWQGLQNQGWAGRGLKAHLIPVSLHQNRQL